jgi:hypothetical protein
MIRRLYGAGPLHAFAMASGAVVIAYAGIRWWQIGPWHLAVWLGGSVAGHDLLLLPAYAATDRILVVTLHRRGTWLVQYVRAPAALSLLLLGVWWPLILNHDPARRSQTGLSAHPFLHRWLLVTAIMFAISAAFAAISVVRRIGVSDVVGAVNE